MRGLLPVLLLLVLAAPASAHPRGAFRPTPGQVTVVGGTQCALVGTVRVPGRTVAGGWFVTDSQQVRNLTRRAKRAHGVRRRLLRQQAARFGAAYTAGRPACNPAPPAAPAPTPTPTSTASPVPLRFAVRDAAALAYAPGTPDARQFVAVSGEGTVSDAVASGGVQVQQFLVAPNDKLYVVLDHVDLADTASSASGCLLAEVDRTSGRPTCVDSTLQSVAFVGRTNPGIQFDDAGAIYYEGAVDGGRTVLRRWSNGVSTDLINDNIELDDFVVAGDGSVIITGRSSTRAEWTRRVRPDGTVESLSALRADWMGKFPDGDVYLGYNTGSYGILRYLPATGALDPVPWFANTYMGLSHVPPSTVCNPQGTPFSQPAAALCDSGGGGHAKRLITTVDGTELAVLEGATESRRGVLARLYPDIRFLDTGFSDIEVAQPVGADLLLSGTNAEGQNVTDLYDPKSGVQRRLIGPDQEVELFHAGLRTGNKVLFDGLRFSDNRYVLGTVDLATGAVTMAPSAPGRLTGFQTY